MDSICWETITILLHMISITRILTIIETEYLYPCIQIKLYESFAISLQLPRLENDSVELDRISCLTISYDMFDYRFQLDMK
jgi:hypothetical protein